MIQGLGNWDADHLKARGRNKEFKFEVGRYGISKRVLNKCTEYCGTPVVCFVSQGTCEYS